MKSKIKRIGFDLDGVVIDKPPFIPKWFVEAIYRGTTKEELSYRYPSHKFEIILRQISHYPLLRPPIKKQVELIKKLHESKKYSMYAVTSRYAFLKARTQQWFDYYEMNGFFEKIYINEDNEQPHIFKEKVIKKLKIQLFIDDDELLVEYLSKELPHVRSVFVDDSIEELNKLI